MAESEWIRFLQNHKQMDRFFDLREPNRLRFFLFRLKPRQQVDFFREFVAYLFRRDTTSLIPLIEAAMRRAELRRLYPYSSLRRLGLSRTPDFESSQGFPIIEPQPSGGYLIDAPDSRQLFVENLEEALTVFVKLLPPDSGSP